MDKKLIHSEIDTLLGIIQQQHWLMSGENKPLQQIDIDLLLENIRKLYSNAILLNQKTPGVERVAVSEPVAAKPINIPAPEVVREQIAPKVDAAPQLAKEGEQKKVEVVAEPAPAKEEVVANNQPLENVIAPVADKYSTPASMLDKIAAIADRFKSAEPSLHEKMSKASMEKGLVDHLQRKPIADLKLVIGINERFQFINGVFKGDAQAFTTSIDFINKCTSLDNAQQFIDQHLKSQYNWNEENEHVQQLMELIERRFL